MDGVLQPFFDAIKRAKAEGKGRLEVAMIFPRLFDGDHRGITTVNDGEQLLVEQTYDINQVFDKWLSEQCIPVQDVINRLLNGASHKIKS